MTLKEVAKIIVIRRQTVPSLLKTFRLDLASNASLLRDLSRIIPFEIDEAICKFNFLIIKY